jgi:mono/diheme cytochrome c family protein
MMPASGYYHLSDEDIGAIIAYARSAPPVDRTLGPSTLNAIGRVAMVVGGAPFLLARSLDHDAPRMSKPEPAVSVAYGDYLARVCSACHGAEMEGDIGPDLRPRVGYAHVDEDRFVEIMRTGVNSKGRTMDPEHMPWPNFARMTDAELGAIWMYLESRSGAH